MSSIVSRSPSFRNQSKDSRWMSIRLGRSRTCLRREKDLRARGAVTVWAKEIVPPLGAMVMRGEAGSGGDQAYYGVRAGKTGCCVGEPPSIGQPTLQPQGTRRGPGMPTSKWYHGFGPRRGPFQGRMTTVYLRRMPRTPAEFTSGAEIRKV